MSRLTALAALVALPPTVLHELTHWAVARLETDDAHIRVEVADAGAQARWPPLDSPWLRAFAFLSPTVFGSILIALWLASDHGINGWRLVMAVGLAIYTAPSPADVRGALGRQDVQQDHDTDTTHQRTD
jgi:hypothetical protein